MNFYRSNEELMVRLEKYINYVISKREETEGEFAKPKEKKDKVFEFRLPEKHHEMKSFLGSCSQYRDHIPNYAQMSAPLHEMIKGYTKGSTKPLEWTTELETKFVELQIAVANCCKLYFMDEDLPIYLHTDASKVGIGGYLYQRKGNQNIPIQFLNKQLNATERKWNTVEKEMYAIYYTFMKLEHLLRDKKFIVKTDSQIVSRMNTEHKEKIKRWKIAIQHYDFDVLHIKGVDNIEADALSRLVPLFEPDAELQILEQTETIQIKTYLDPAIYAKIKKVHNGREGHGGVQRTINLLRRLKINWPSMRKDVSSFIQNCPCCQKMQRLKPQIRTIPFTLASYEPMKRICIDAIGPIHIEGTEYKHILVFIDAFSRYVKLFPLTAVNSEQALHALNQWVADFGCPSEIVSDNASYFLSELIKSFIDFAKIEHSTIHPYSHEENGIVERANQEVIRHLTAIIIDNDIRKNWPKYLPFVQRIMNTQVKASIGISPTEMIFGNSVNHDDHFLTVPETTKRDDPPHEHIKELMAAQERILQIARRNQESHDTYVIAERSKDNSQSTTFPINSYVLVQYETQKSSKLHTSKHGPYRVINHIGTIYTCEHLVTKKIKDYHVKLLSEYKHDEVNSDIARAAKLDDEYCDIEGVHNHKFVPPHSKRKTDLFFLLTWDDDMDPKWYRWNTTLGDNELIHKYLDENRMRMFIPQKYTFPKDHPEEIARREKKKNENITITQTKRKRTRKRKGF